MFTIIRQSLILIFGVSASFFANSQNKIDCPTFNEKQGGEEKYLTSLFSFSDFERYASKFSLVGGEAYYNTLKYYDYQTKPNRKAEIYYGIELGSIGALEFEIANSGICFNLTPCVESKSNVRAVYIARVIDRFASESESNGFDREGFVESVRGCYDAVVRVFYPDNNAVVKKILKSVQPYSFKEPVAALEKHLIIKAVANPDSVTKALFNSDNDSVWLNAIEKYGINAYDLLFDLSVYNEYDDFSFEEAPHVKTKLLRVLDAGFNYYEDLVQFIKSGEYEINISEKVLGLRLPSNLVVDSKGNPLIAKVKGSHQSMNNRLGGNYSFEQLDLPENIIFGTKVEIAAKYAKVFKCPFSGPILEPYSMLITDTSFTLKGNANYRYNNQIAGEWVLALNHGTLTFKKNFEASFDNLILNKNLITLCLEIKSEDGQSLSLNKHGKPVFITRKKLEHILKKSKLNRYKLVYDKDEKILRVEILHNGK